MNASSMITRVMMKMTKPISPRDLVWLVGRQQHWTQQHTQQKRNVRTMPIGTSSAKNGMFALYYSVRSACNESVPPSTARLGIDMMLMFVNIFIWSKKMLCTPPTCPAASSSPCAFSLVSAITSKFSGSHQPRSFTSLVSSSMFCYKF